MRHTSLIVLFLTTLAGLANHSGQAGDKSSAVEQGLRRHPPAVFALTNATVHVDPATLMDDAVIVVRDGMIESVESDGEIPADARVIDLDGRHVYAGFIDAYSETSVSSDGLDRSADHWNPEVVPQLRVADQIPADESALAALRKQGFAARLTAPSGGIVRGTGTVLSTASTDPAFSIIAADVTQQIQLAVTRRGRDNYPGSPMGAVALARQTMHDARWYRDAWNAAKADPTLPRPEHNAALEALQPVIDGKRPVIAETFNELYSLRADRFAAEFGLDLILRGNGYEYRRLDDIAAAGRAVILPLAFPDAPEVADADAARDVRLETLMHWDLAPENPARLHQAGVRTAFTTDRLDSVGDFLKQLRKAVKRGLPKDAALHSLTTVPAELFGITDQLGSVRAGRRASLVVADGDIFEADTKVIETWVDGRRFEYVKETNSRFTGRFELKLTPSADRPAALYLTLTEKGSSLAGTISRVPSEVASDENTEVEEAEKTPPEDAGKGDSPAEKRRRRRARRKAAKQNQDNEESAQDEAQKNTPAESEPEISLKGVTAADSTVAARFASDDWGLKGVCRLNVVITEGDGDSPQITGRLTWPDGSTVAVSGSRTADADSADEPKDESAGSEDEPAEDSGEATADASSHSHADHEHAHDEEHAHAHAAVDSSAEKETDDSAASDSEATSDAATFPVNYPLGAFGRETVPEQAGTTAFTHATIWTCGPQGILHDATLVIRDGVVVAAGADVEIPDGADVVDARGMHITPGIIDCHSHMATDGGVNESTQAVTCEVRIGDFIDCDDITIYRQLAGGVTAASILHGSANPIGGQNQVIKLRWGMNDEEMKFREAPPGVKFALGENVKQSNWGDDYRTRYPQTRMGVVQIIRDSFEAAREYAARMDDWQQNRRGLPPRRDLELDALREVIEQKRWIHCHSYRQDEILALIRLLDEYGITIGTFQHILEGYKVADEMARHGAMGSAFSDWWAYKFEVRDAIPWAGAIMHRAGVVVSFNSDDAELARHLNQEAAKAVKYGGLSPEEALKFVTLNPAIQLRIDQYVGSLESGKHADFVLWNGDPLSNMTRCEQTWIDGRRFFDIDEDQELRRQVAERRNTLIQKILDSGARMSGNGEDRNDPSGLWPRHDEFCHHDGHDHTHDH